MAEPGEPQPQPPQPQELPQTPQDPRPGFRGRCLYKTGKCTNERALKTSGAAHNLCEEHRNRQNQHQRKLDAKNRVARKDKRGAGGRSPGADAAAPRTPAARFSPYPVAAVAAAKKRSASLDATDMAALASAAPPTAATAPASVQSPPATGMHGLALQHATVPGDAAATVTAAAAGAAAAVAAAANSGGMVYLPNGPQPPQLAYPFVMQDFDGIVVPLPSYLEGQDRIEFRARIYQKVLDFISEECILRFSGAGARALPDSKAPSAADRPNDSAVAPATARSVSSSSSTSTEAGAASPTPAVAVAAQPSAEEPAGADVGAEPGTPTGGASKRLKRAARS